MEGIILRTSFKPQKIRVISTPCACFTPVSYTHLDVYKRQLVDLRTKYPDLTGKVAEKALVAADITVNKNMVPFDSRSDVYKRQVYGHLLRC